MYVLNLNSMINQCMRKTILSEYGTVRLYYKVYLLFYNIFKIQNAISSNFILLLIINNIIG